MHDAAPVLQSDLLSGGDENRMGLGIDSRRWLRRSPSGLMIALVLKGALCFDGGAAFGQEQPPTKASQPSKASGESGYRAPKWAGDARWYHIVVPRFHNGDPSNDPPDTLPWTADWPVHAAPAVPAKQAERDAAKQLNARRYGGDLQGLRMRLEYLKTLGVSALYLDPIFHGAVEYPQTAVDLRHIDDSFGIKGSGRRIAGETADPKTWRFSATDRLFLDFVKEAHKMGFRVVLLGLSGRLGAATKPSKDVERHLFAVTRRWMDPNADGDPHARFGKVIVGHDR